MQHGMPVPTPEHERLIAAMTGDWVAEETTAPSPWDPRGGTSTARTRSRAAVGGLFVITDYAQEKGGREVFFGHGVYGWDPRAQRYTMQWWDSMGFAGGEPVHGTWEGDTLTFARAGEGTMSRYVYQFGPGTYRFTIAASRDGGASWSTMMEGRYRRVYAAGAR